MNQSLNSDKMHENDRVLVIRPAVGKVAKTSGGLLDASLFTENGNKIVASFLEMEGLWSIRYLNGGVLPAPLRQKFTSFNKLRSHLEDYLSRRDLVVTEVRDGTTGHSN